MVNVGKVKFHKFSEISLYDCVGTIGVYVVWDDKSRLIPTYIGKGKLFDRLASHHLKFRPPLDGYVAIFGEIGEIRADQLAEMLEAMLLLAADETNRLSENNKQGGRLAKIKEYLKRHNLVRALITGYDPFSPPRCARYLPDNKKFLRAFIGENGSVEIEHRFQCLRGSSV